MRIGVYGPKGMLGRAVVGLATAYGHEVIALEARIDDDLAVEAELNQQKRLDVAINCAGKRVADPAELASSNTVGPHVLAKMVGLGKLRRLIHVSTDCVFEDTRHIIGDATVPMGFEAGDPVRPATLYGKTKAAGEPLGVPVTVVRTSFVGLDHGLLGDMIARARHDGTSVATYHGWVNAWWSGSSVYEVARQLARLAESVNDPGWPSSVIHLATATPVRKADVVEAIIKATGMPLTALRREHDPFINRALQPSPGWVLAPFVETLEELVPLIRSRLK